MSNRAISTRAPAVYEWVSRMWNAKPDDTAGFVSAVPADAAPLLKEICETHLEQLAANASAYAGNSTSFEMTIQGCRYTKMPISRYRVWCLEKLREAFFALDKDAQSNVQSLLPYDQAALLWAEAVEARSEYDTDGDLPFGNAINVYGTGTP